jgi:hypothetical protein
MVTCLVRYELDMAKLADFTEYARTWMRLIEKFGGTHHGYFIPASQPPSAEVSFPGIGTEGPPNVGFALFSFPSTEAYNAYRREVPFDPECIAATATRNSSQCFTAYERVFLDPVDR